MAKFKKKPVVIEAIQFKDTKEGLAAILRFVNTNLILSITDDFPTIYTLEGAMTVSADDWVIRGVAGEFYPCKPDIFEQTYEAVE